MSAGVVLLAAGSGRRMGSVQPKQFLTLNGEPLFMSSLRVFASLLSVREIVVVCAPDRMSFVEKWIRRLKVKKNIHAVPGGRIRGESVRRGVLALSPSNEVVLVHDAARALVTRAIVGRVQAAAKKTGAALAAWPLADTLKSSAKFDRVRKTISRRGLWLAQTPQGFRRDVALKCLLEPSPTATDDAELAERKGFRVQLVTGGPTNMKVTYPTDLKICRRLLKR
jgi:2-C-methyl-D-erythritol 4-phosphate cytidylyltransferase